MCQAIDFSFKSSWLKWAWVSRRFEEKSNQLKARAKEQYFILNHRPLNGEGGRKRRVRRIGDGDLPRWIKFTEKENRRKLGPILD